MSRVKFVLLLSATAGAMCSGAEAAPLISFSLNLPAPTVAVNQALSPSAVAARLAQQGFRVQEMYRRGPAYAVTATGRSGNKVLLMVDGHSGVIIGMSVLAAVVPVVPLTASNARFIDDTHPFGAVVPEVIYEHWDRYSEPQWVQPGPAAIVVTPTYAPYQYAVPFKFVHTSPRSHKSYAIAPPKYHGMQLRNSAGQQIRAEQTRADAADAEAAYQAERADQATYDKEQALDQRDAADQRAADLDKENDALAKDADEQQKRAEDAEARNEDLQKQLEEKGQADSPCDPMADGCGGGTPENLNNPPQQEETPAGPEKPVEAEPTSPEGNPTEERQPAAPEQSAQPEQPARQEEPQAAPQEQPPPQQEAAPQQEEQAAPREEPAPQEEAPPAEEPQMDNGGGGGGDDGGGGGGGDDGGGDQ